MGLDKNGTARRIAQELRDGWYVNLGIGIPTLVANHIPEGISVDFQSENGILGMGPFPFEGEEDADLINAGKQTITALGSGSQEVALMRHLTSGYLILSPSQRNLTRMQNISNGGYRS